MSANLSLDNFQTVNSVPLFQTKNRLAVYCPVVSPVRSVLSHGHPQKKGVSPGNCLNKIKSVKSVTIAIARRQPVPPNERKDVLGFTPGRTGTLHSTRQVA